MPEAIKYLTADQVLELHEIALTVGPSGGVGLRAEQRLLSAVFQPQQTFGGDDLYPSVQEKAAAYGYFIAENQPFIDGNKRTAALCLTVFLDLNGYDLWEASEEELAEVFEGLGRHTMDQGAFFDWVINHAKRREEP